ncbi:carbohydrate ABC transporter permease [Paramaledivibacter caminithermalis]|uniref:Carbohydrate ABC transporter membrane protein 1, CUT1 family n=1 Tax=Paramaledivibacter caminithermalis (strain DSM 15212 / CIP 107654 / DViRD3) TaxID=1121301 RepID=A0A1M6QVR4_PARC5|nr:sugar ABC transporter permease [Paramaledivibacter caminithermalis]SHK24157.1 carbohydrate ABC transporter membrane protein 1, CUT1 family [Paramaledivibacter caminithermalis DSM 15212]
MNNRNTFKSFIKGILYILPALVILGVFRIYPILKSLDMSFYTKYNYFKDVVYERGFDNFIYIFNDEEFIVAIKNTFTFVLGVVPLSISISLFIAIILNSQIKFQSFFRGIYFIPFVTSIVAISAVWRWIYNSEFGILNYFLGLFGIDPIKWLLDPNWAMISLIILSIWKGLGYNIVILLAGLQNIDKQYYLAAKVDGASKAQIFFYITLPLLSPTIFFVSIMSMINSFKVFDEVYVLFDKIPGPMGRCLTMVYYIYDKFANEYVYGIASAAVYILFMIVLFFTIIQLYIGNKKVYYN